MARVEDLHEAVLLLTLTDTTDSEVNEVIYEQTENNTSLQTKENTKTEDVEVTVDDDERLKKIDMELKRHSEYWQR